MMKSQTLTGALLVAAAGLSGCSYMSSNPLYGDDGLVRNRSQDYESAQAQARLEIPPHLQTRALNEQLVVPVVGDTATVRQEDFKVPRPEFFYADTGSERVNLSRLGDEKVIVVDEPIADVWVKLQDFWRFNGIELAKSDPRQGQMESGWIRVDGKEYGFADRWIRKLTFQETETDTRNKLRISLKPDPENYARTSIRIDHVAFPFSQQVDTIDWNGQSTDVGYKSDMMFDMLRYLSKATADSSAQSLLALQQRDSTRPLLGRDSRGNPTLKIETSIDKAWNLIDGALTAAQLDVGTRDQEAGIFYLTYTTTTPVDDTKKAGFFEWLHGERDDIKLDTALFERTLGFGDADSENGISYSAKQTDRLVEGEVDQSDLADPDNLANREGYKIWFAGKVIYVFGDDGRDGGLNRETGNYEFVGRYQLHMNRTRSGSYLSVATAEGLEAPALVAEEILWSIKDHLPAG
ncbi:outer membrane protein assembly factor BamC [Marinobacterium rhizophilum]|uniref:Outer membrane protein assembly factor BamC n=1 Tax=Marinobacterium rhizophilum TaxID=420402 RepID=A0ABY5HMP5_9GAMM|nr:outer membrane protein assembly factor BamC [Marinobacterium rhizophilum]UTW13692.1 outer membrane protein assembly factor BamC [Marinobacterium rhizophilum]